MNAFGVWDTIPVAHTATLAAQSWNPGENRLLLGAVLGLPLLVVLAVIQWKLIQVRKQSAGTEGAAPLSKFSLIGAIIRVIVIAGAIGLLVWKVGR